GGRVRRPASRAGGREVRGGFAFLDHRAHLIPPVARPGSLAIHCPAMDYREAGVDIDAADEAKSRIKALARGTFSAAVLSEIGSFGAMFLPDFSRYEEPVLVASTDGVGTKIQVARAAGVPDTVGYDLVAHCVNDILVQGAVPLFFLDYIAVGRMDPRRVEQIVAGFARGCAELGCPLIGGETAEMPGTYAPDDYDLAGFIVGVVD